MMSRRRIGQEVLKLSPHEGVQPFRLDTLSTLIDRLPTELRLNPISSAAKGEPAWPPLALFNALSSAVWYDLSDVNLAEALDRAWFRRICGFSAHEATPECNAFKRFRRQLVVRALDV